MKVNYSWCDFVKEELYEDLCSFFAQVLGDAKKNNELVIFVSRRMYCLFLLLKKRKLINDSGVRIITDRYILKNWDKSEITEEVAVLVDDVMSTGQRCKELYKEIQTRTDIETINVFVFMQSKDLTDIPKFGNENRLYAHLIKSENEILRFCAIESLIFHQENIPYFIELPYLCETGSKDDSIVLSEEEFENLKKGNANWDYFECNQTGYLQNIIEDGVMVMKNNLFIDCYPQIVYDFTVKLQISEDEDGGKRIVCSPFAIFKSISFSDLYDFFVYIFRDTSYCRDIKRCQKIYKADYKQRIYIAMYRALVYVFSYYIGERFIEFIQRITEKEGFEFQKNSDQYCYSQKFRKSINDIFGMGCDQFVIRAYMFHSFSDVEFKNRFKLNINKYQGIGREYKSIYLYILVLLNDLRESNTQKSDGRRELQDRFLSIEDLQDTLVYNLSNEDEEYLHDSLTACICAMLEQGKMANELIYNAEKDVIYRGFTYGKNSEAVFDLSLKAFYAGVEIYFQRIEEHNYAKYYNTFLLYLRQVLKDNNLYGSMISQDEFRLYAEMFRKRKGGKMGKKIRRLEFLIESKEPYYIDTIRQYIQQIDFEDL